MLKHTTDLIKTHCILNYINTHNKPFISKTVCLFGTAINRPKEYARNRPMYV